jgi:hypothetical protein
MPPPASVRYTSNAPFPALVTGIGPIVINKQNGVWSVSYNVAPLALQTPPFADPTHEFFTAWNSVSSSFSRIALSSVLGGGGGAGTTVFASRAVAISAVIAPATPFVLTEGYAAAGDGGGALYIPAVGTTTGGFQSADGQWWQIAHTGYVDTRQFGGTLTQAVIDSLPDGTIVNIANGATVNAITLTSRNLDFVFAPGTINISGTIYLNLCIGVTFTGSGIGNPGGGTSLQWTGNNSAIPVFKLTRSQLCAFRNFSLTISQSNQANAAFWTTRANHVDGVINTTACIWEDINIEGTDGIGMAYGIRIGATGDTPGDNNEFHKLTRVGVNNYKTAAYSIEQAESKTNSFIDCGFSGNGIGQYGITTAQNGGFGGSYIWKGGGGGGNTKADFWLGTVDDFISIKDFNVEGSPRLLESDVAASAAWAVTLENGRFAGSGLNADGHAIYFRNRGPLIVQNVAFENVGAVTALDLFIDMSGNPTPPPFTRGIALAIGCVIGTTLANPLVTNNPSNGRWYNLGSVFGNGGGDFLPLPFGAAPVLTYDQLTTSPSRGMLATVQDANVATPGAIISSGGGPYSVLAGILSGTANYVVVAAEPVGPTMVTGATYTILGADTDIIANFAGTVTLTLPTASASTGRQLRVKTITNNTVVSASSNVVPIGSTSAGTAILAATIGKSALLESNGANWVVMAADVQPPGPTSVTSATYTVLGSDTDIIANFAGTVTLTMPNAANFLGRQLRIKTITNNTVVSASSAGGQGVVPQSSTTAGTAILAATNTKWAILESDGTNWVTMASN